jgi:tRNA (cmo5U34)-methyltransferase
MLDACRKKLAEHGIISAQLIEADLAQIDLPPCSAILCNYTLQFVHPEQRVEILKRLYAALNPGGALVLTEKIRHAEPRLHELVVELHHKLKSINGYTELEIAQKRDALENVLIPLTLAKNLSNLREAGFVQTEVVLGLYNFVTLVAVKERCD